MVPVKVDRLELARGDHGQTHTAHKQQAGQEDQGEQGFGGSYLAGTGFLGAMVELTLGGDGGDSRRRPGRLHAVQGDSMRRLANPGDSGGEAMRALSIQSAAASRIRSGLLLGSG